MLVEPLAAAIGDNAYIVPSFNTAAIQESHIVAGHALMEMVEDSVLNAN